MEEVDLTPMIESFSEFFSTIYKHKINEVILAYPGKKSIDVDYQDLEKFDTDLADRLITDPEHTIKAAEESIKSMNLKAAVGIFTPHVRFFNLTGSDILIEKIDSSKIGALIAFKGVVTRRADIMHKIKLAVYGCEVCDSKFKFIVEKNFIPPRRCPSCKKMSLVALTDDSTFLDVQRAEVQELLERVRGGTPAAKIELWLEDDLVNSLVPGDNIEVSGILKLKPPMKFKNRQELVYSRFIDVLHVRNLKRDFEEIEITQEDERRILELSTKPDLEKIIATSIAPHIYGYEEVKRAIALQLFGGTRGKLIRGSVPVRDDIHILLIGDPGIAKCVDGSTKVILADGSVQKISDIVEDTFVKKGRVKTDDGYYTKSNHDLLSFDLDAKIHNSKATVFWKLKSTPVLHKVKTSSGKEVIVTPEHPFFVSDNGFVKAKKASEVKEKDFIATPRILPINGSLQKLPVCKKGKTNSNKPLLPEYLTNDFARMLGYLIGDGCMRKTKTSYEVSLTNCEEKILEDFRNILISFNIPYTERKNKGATEIAVFSLELGRVLEKIGATGKARTKIIPQSILRSPNYVLKEFLRGYFDCDSTVGKEGLTIVSASKELIQLTQYALLRFGILSQFHHTHSRATNGKNLKKSVYYRLSILGENAKKFYGDIGFISRKNTSKAGKFKKKFNTNVDVVPNLSGILKALRTSLFLTQFECMVKRTSYQHYERGDRNPSYSALSRVLEAFEDRYKKIEGTLEDEDKREIKNKLSILTKLCNSHIFWDRVLSNRRIDGKDRWLYDLQVDPAHNFVANGLIVHNSQFLQNSTRLAPKSIYVSGKSVTATGLTVSAEKDELGDGGWTLKAGALVLASGGCVSLDEFDKISEEDRSALHEVLESQTVSVAKAGIVAKFRAKTAVLAAANPKYGRFDQTKNIAEQFQIPPTLLSRFDLIFPIFDILDEEKDSKLADHILNSHVDAGTGEYRKEEEYTVDTELLRKYIAYARRNTRPLLTKESTDMIKNFYIDLRKIGKDSGSVAITPRYLEGLVRLSESNAKMRLSPLVEVRDTDVAITLMNYVLSKVMTDRETGRIDSDIIATGHSRTQVERMQKVDTIRDIIRVQMKQYDSAEVDAVITEAQKYGIDEPVARRILDELLRKGELYEKEPGHVRLVETRES